MEIVLASPYRDKLVERSAGSSRKQVQTSFEGRVKSLAQLAVSHVHGEQRPGGSNDVMILPLM